VDPRDFDRFTRLLTAPTRRVLLSTISGLVTGTMAGGRAELVSAKKPKKRKKKQKNKAKSRTLGEGCGGSKGNCISGLQCCNGVCKLPLFDGTCTPDLNTGQDATCCTGFCDIVHGCCAGPTQACSPGQCCDGLNCEGTCCKPLGATCANADECCGDDTSCPSATRKCTKSCALSTNGSVRAAEECCDNPITIRGETCCPHGSGNGYYCGRFHCNGYLTGTGPGGCDLWCDTTKEGSACGPGIPGIPTGENNGRACCCTAVGTNGQCVWP
jgi:hypothetical protein